jgi:hypothetical protein
MKSVLIVPSMFLLAGFTLQGEGDTGIRITRAQAELCKQSGCETYTQDQLVNWYKSAYQKGYDEGYKKGDDNICWKPT